MPRDSIELWSNVCFSFRWRRFESRRCCRRRRCSSTWASSHRKSDCRSHRRYLRCRSMATVFAISPRRRRRPTSARPATRASSGLRSTTSRNVVTSASTTWRWAASRWRRFSTLWPTAWTRRRLHRRLRRSQAGLQQLPQQRQDQDSTPTPWELSEWRRRLVETSSLISGWELWLELWGEPFLGKAAQGDRWQLRGTQSTSSPRRPTAGCSTWARRRTWSTCACPIKNVKGQPLIFRLIRFNLF